MWLVATEDEVSEAVARKLLADVGVDAETADYVRRNGYGYLRKKLGAFCKIRHRPILLLTDLDQQDCAPNLKQKWFGGNDAPNTLVFRVAVREVEAWLIADRDGLAAFLRVTLTSINRDPEGIGDPKRYLIDLARNAPREIREDLTPRRGSIAPQGFGYNNRICQFISDRWSVQRAANASDSLRRARTRLRQCADTWHSQP